MELAGLNCEVVVSNVDETIDGLPDEQVKKLSLRKAIATIPLLKDFGDEPAVVIAADTLVYINGDVLGKPESHDEAFKMLKSLSGNRHEVYTGVTIIKLNSCKEGRDSTEKIDSFVEKTGVYFHDLSDDEINAYIETGEPFDKAGAYGVQEKGAVLVSRVDGDFYTVVGLPISRVYRVLSGMGIVL